MRLHRERGPALSMVAVFMTIGLAGCLQNDIDNTIGDPLPSIYDQTECPETPFVHAQPYCENHSQAPAPYTGSLAGWTCLYSHETMEWFFDPVGERYAFRSYPAEGESLSIVAIGNQDEERVIAWEASAPHETFLVPIDTSQGFEWRKQAMGLRPEIDVPHDETATEIFWYTIDASEDPDQVMPLGRLALDFVVRLETPSGPAWLQSNWINTSFWDQESSFFFNAGATFAEGRAFMETWVLAKTSDQFAQTHQEQKISRPKCIAM